MPAYNVSAISNPEFINVNSLSPFAAKCQIKVLYVGQNRNKSFITKEVAINMAKTLPGCPIVGYYKEEMGDFRDHGEVATIEEGKIRVEKKTKAYGFIPPNAKVWFQNFEETDEYGIITVREYLLVEGYLWTQFEEAKLPLEGGQPQSMELDEKSLQGYWSNELNSSVEFFIINDAKFKALCILGKDVEPCFEGANVTGPETYSLEEKEIISGLSDIMKQLQFTLNKLEGGNQKMLENQDKIDEKPVVENQDNIENFVKSKEEEEKDKTDKESNTNDASTEGKDSPENKEEEDKKKKVVNNSLSEYDGEDGGDADTSAETADVSADDTSNEEPVEVNEPVADSSEEQDEEEDKDDDESIGNTSIEKLKKNYSLLKKNFSELQTKYSTLEESYSELVKFKNEIENDKKDKMIESFYMLDDKDKEDVIKNKSKYTLDEIESKLSVICVRKKVNFDLDSDRKHEDEVPTTYDLNGMNSEASLIPAWLKAVEATQNRNK